MVAETIPVDRPLEKEEASAGAKPRGFWRRWFGSFMALGFWALGLASGLWGLATLRMLFPNTVSNVRGPFKAGFPGDYPRGHVEGRFKGIHGVWIVHGQYQGQWQIFALRAVCTHLGCLVEWEESQRRFRCPCHGSQFSATGMNLGGPAPRPLVRLAIRIAEDGQLEVDPGREFHEERAEWGLPGSYVRV